MGSYILENIPEDTKLAGYAYLIQNLGLNLPLKNFIAVSNHTIKNNRYNDVNWTIYSNTYWPGDDLFTHLLFALKYETLNLLFLGQIFLKIDPKFIEEKINQSSSGIHIRKIWFLYEWLIDSELNINTISGLSYVKLLDEDDYYTGVGIKSVRHKIINNLIGVKKFNIIIEKTEKLKKYNLENLNHKAIAIIQNSDKRLLSRAASFLLLADTKATYEIEGERAPQNRLEKWAKVILEAGKNQLSLEEITRLHQILFKDNRFIKFGIRDTEVFLGDRDYNDNPIPEFIGAKSEDLDDLMKNWLELNEFLKSSNLNPIIQAAIIAFSFIYIHPLQDGNGRIHRFLFHHILAERNFTPKGLIFPVSSVMLDSIEDYKEVLIEISKPIMSLINWESDDKKNVKIIGDTKYFYQFFNLTTQTEYFCEVVKKTIEINLPQELAQLNKFDKARVAINNYIEIPDNDLSLLINVIVANKFKLSKTKRDKFFVRLQAEEINHIEKIIENVYCHDA